MYPKTPFSIMIFANGPDCNLNCEYCYYNNNNNLYKSENEFAIDLETIEIFIKKYIDSQPGPAVQFIWQGGESTLRGLDFFKKVLKIQHKYLPDNWKVYNTIQTNGINFNDSWFHFLSKNDILIGLSLDGDRKTHDKNRKDFFNTGSYNRVIKTLYKLQKHKIPYNILTVVSKINVKKAKKIYYHFKTLNIKYMQFIPLVNQIKNSKNNGSIISDISINGKEYGDFLIELFEQWIIDLEEIYIQMFSETLNSYLSYPSNLCVFSTICGRAIVMDHLGDIYSCDHFVDENYKLGNIKNESLVEIVNSNIQINFALNKRTGLTEKCQSCRFLFLCNGGCPKNRIADIGEKKELNILCEGYYNFFSYSEEKMIKIKKYLKKGFNISEIKKKLLSK